MKKLLCVLLAAAVALSLLCCGRYDNSSDQNIYVPDQGTSNELKLIEDSSAPDRSEKPSSPSGRAEKGSSQSPQKSEGGSPDSEPQSSNASSEPQGGRKTLDKNGTYTSRDDVALYIRLYNTLPENFITKREAEALGWTGGSLEPYAPGKCIGGGRFGNYEGALPDKKGRKYWECDIDTLGRKSRGAKRIVYSNDGLIYYTGDHYKTFTLLYGEE